MRRVLAALGAVAAAHGLGRADDLKAAAAGNDAFALALFAELSKGHPGNLFVSPFSAHQALAMTAAGAKGDTRDQMDKVLRLPADVGAVGDLGRVYARPQDGYEVAVANAVWGQRSFPWRPEFVDRLRDRFAGGFRPADFAADPDGERRRINQWAEDNTRGRIKDLLAEGAISADQRMVLANAVYFKGPWENPFDPKQTSERPFTLADGTTTKVPTMHREGNFRRYLQPKAGGDFGEFEFQVAELPYKGGDLSMVVLVPGRHDGLPALEAELAPDALSGWLAKATGAGNADLYLPKFRIATDQMMLAKPLQAMGMTALFDPRRADLTGMHTGDDRLFVDLVIQKAFVDMTEEGTEAAAATAVGVRTTSASVDFRADRPFLFAIRDAKRGTILFVGRVAKP